MGTEEQKAAAARHAAGMVQDGMAVGLGSGTTAEIAVHALGLRYKEGLRFTGVPTSKATEAIARAYGIPLERLEEHRHLDLYIDGADEVDPDLNLVKGHGGALLREKLVASAATRFVVMVDGSKLVTALGEHAPIPVEVVQFGWPTIKHRVEGLGLKAHLRHGEHGRPYLTSNHNYILDCEKSDGLDVARQEMAEAIKLQTGVVEHGLFLRMAAAVIVGRDDGTTETLTR
jgi:ribose 5-phosphate isomerase A